MAKIKKGAKKSASKSIKGKGNTAKKRVQPKNGGGDRPEGKGDSTPQAGHDAKPADAPGAGVAGVEGVAAPAPEAPAAAPAERPIKSAEEIAAASKEKERTHAEEVKRLKKLGLVEVPVKGSVYSLVGMASDKQPPNVEQRVEMAKRLNAVGPLLPRYVQHLVDEKRPASSTKAIVKIAANIVEGDAMRETLSKQKADAKAPKPTKREAAKAKAEAKKADAKKGKADGKKPAAAPAPAKKKAGGIGGLCEKLLVEGKTNDDILKAVKKDFPNAKTSAASIAWYRSKLRDEGKLPKA